LFDSGNYTCIVWNEHGSIQHTFVVDIVCKTIQHSLHSFVDSTHELARWRATDFYRATLY